MALFGLPLQLPGIGNAFETMCDAVLPKELEFVGDLAGLAADLKTGNFVGAFEHATDLVKDLPQQLENLKKSKSGDDGLMTPTWSYEPDAPITRSQPDGSGNQTQATPTPPPPSPLPAPSGGWRGTPPIPNQGVTAPAPSAGWRGVPVAPNQGGTAPVSRSGGGSSSKADGPSGAGKTDLLGMSNEELMKAVRSGNLPKDLDPAQLLTLQARVNEISQMNQLMTSMMRALHDMSMAILQNVRA